jgi:excisionase family DNA binding protein
MHDINNKRTLTIEEAAELLGIGRNTTYEAARKGEIPVIRIGRRLLVPKAALDRMLSIDEEDSLGT